MSRSAQRAARRGITAAATGPGTKIVGFDRASRTRGEAKGDGAAETSVGTVETELKLLCDREQLAALAASPTIAGHAYRQGETIELTAIYYDTPNLVLWRSGSVLRVRSDGAHSVMTLKSKRRRASGKMLERVERSASVKGLEPDLRALARLLPAEIFAQVEARLQPVFRTEVLRHTRTLDTALGTVEVALDQGRIIAGEQSEEIGEVELELVEGSAGALFQLAQELATQFPLRPSIRSKAARGYELAFHTAPGIPKAPKLK